jgi:hypothetical protein
MTCILHGIIISLNGRSIASIYLAPGGFGDIFISFLPLKREIVPMGSEY